MCALTEQVIFTGERLRFREREREIERERARERGKVINRSRGRLRRM